MHHFLVRAWVKERVIGSKITVLCTSALFSAGMHRLPTPFLLGYQASKIPMGDADWVLCCPIVDIELEPSPQTV